MRELKGRPVVPRRRRRLVPVRSGGDCSCGRTSEQGAAMRSERALFAALSLPRFSSLQLTDVLANPFSSTKKNGFSLAF